VKICHTHLERPRPRLTNCANRCIIINNQEVINTLWYGNRGVGNLRLIGLVGLGPASRVFTFHLLDSLLTATTNTAICPHMTSYSNMAGLCGSTLYDCERRHAGGRRYLHDAHPYPRVKRVGSFGGYPSTEPGLKAATWDSHPCGVRNCLDLLALAGRLRLGSWGIILEFCHIALIEYILRDISRHLTTLSPGERT